MSLNPNSLEARDVASVLHPYTHLARHEEQGPLVLERGDGVYVYDTHGKQYLEGMAGLWCTSLGYGEQELIDAATQQMQKLSFSHLFTGRSHEPAIELAEKLKARAPMETGRVFFVGSGSEANDTAIKMVWYAMNALGKPQKKKIISRQRAYHGVTIGSASLTGLPPNHAGWDLPLDRFLHTSAPLYYRGAEAGESKDEFVTRLMQELEDLILREGPDTIAAMWAEPIQGAGGVIIPPESYFPQLQALLKKYHIWLVVDEVITGFCRTGNYWGSQTFDIQPDIITCAKALSSAYLPIGAVLVAPHVYDALKSAGDTLGAFAHGNTYAAHPVCAAVASRAIDLYDERNILGHVQSLIPLFQQRLASFADHPLVGDVRLGAGLMGGIELVADKDSKQPFDPKLGMGMKLSALAEEQGLIVRVLGDVIAVCPPLIITAAQVDELFNKLEKAVAGLEAA